MSRVEQFPCYKRVSRRFLVIFLSPSSFLSTRAQRLCSSPPHWVLRLSPRHGSTIKSLLGFSKRSELTHANKVTFFFFFTL